MKKLISIIALLPAISLASSFYLVGGIGEAHNKLNGNGVWYQEGFDHSLKSRSTTYHIGAGYQVADWLTVEGLYHDFGETHISADFVFPDANYNLDTHKCNGRCNPVAHGEGTGHASGYSLSLLPTYGVNRDWSVYGRLGALWYRRSWQEDVSCCAKGTYHDGDTYGPKLNATDFLAGFLPVGNDKYRWSGDNGQVMPNSHGVAMIWGLGINYRRARVEYMATQGIKALGSGHTDIGTVSVSYRAQF